MNKTHVFRVKPNEELLQSIMNYCREHEIISAVVVNIIGSLNNATLGFLKELPGKYISKGFKGPLEIISGQGTVAKKGDEVIAHIHLTISDENSAYGGHLIEAVVFSTAEVVLQEPGFRLEREKDGFTGLNELKQG
jgi:hypothetical protein